MKWELFQLGKNGDTWVGLAEGARGLMMICFPQAYKMFSLSGPHATEYTGEPGGTCE